jgi:hypothetical protein
MGTRIVRMRSASRGGSLDEPVDLTEAIHIWTGRKLRGVIIPAGNRQYSGEPDETGLT